MTKAQQHTLFSTNEVAQSFDNFYGRGNQLLKEKLMGFIQSKDSVVGYIYGEAGMGKTHLLKSCCYHGFNPLDDGLCRLYLNYRELNEMLLEHLQESVRDYCEKMERSENASLNIMIVVDDLTDTKLSENTDVHSPNELCLLSIYELLKKINDDNDGLVKLICASSKPPKQLAIRHKDLQTRLSTAIVYPIIYADDIEKQEIIKSVALNRGVVLKTEIMDYIFSHYSRRLPNLIRLINELDSISLQQQRKVTVQLVKQAIANIAE